MKTATFYGSPVLIGCHRAKEIEEALRRSEARLRLALKSAQAGIWEWDVRRSNDTWSEELWKLYGLDLPAAEGKAHELK